MAREMKLGIAVIGILLVVFCGLLAKRLTRPSKLPLSNTSSSTATNAKPAPIKNANPTVRPIVVTPQTEPKGSSNLVGNPGHDDAQVTGWPKPPQRYTATAWPKNSVDQNAAPETETPPNLLTNQAPIQDLNAKPSKALPYQTGYASDSQTANADLVPEAHQAPYSSQGTALSNNNSVVANGTATASRYPDYGLPESSKPVMGNDPFKDNRSSNSPYPPTSIQRDSGSKGANTPSQYFSASNTAASQSQANNSLPGYGKISYADSTNASQWQGLPTTSIQESSAPIQRNGEKYTVQPNDTFWSICEKTYGSGAFFKALYEYNRKRHKAADELVLGQELLVPDENVLRRIYPDLCPRQRKAVASTEQRLVSVSTKLRGTGRIYKVVEGDTLFEIARYELGKSSRWAEIYELNRDVLGDDFDYLRPGTELILPNDGVRSDSITRQPQQIVPEHRSRY